MKLTTALKAAALASVFTLSMGAAQAQTLNMMNGGEPASLDPHRVSGDWENRIVGDYIEGLMTEDAEATPILGAAESYDLSDDGLVYTFVIREDSVWSDGEPVTAGDFVFAFQRLMNPETAAGYAYLQYPIKNAEAVNAGEMELSELGVRAVDDKTLEITLENPTPYFLGALTHYTAYPVPQHAVEEFGDAWTQPANIVGNGPYTPTEWVPGSHVRAVKSETYHDAENVQIQEVMYYSLDDLTAAVNRYRAGEFDILTDFPADQVTTFANDEAKVAAFQGVHYYVMNQTAEKLQDVNVRKALSMAINREVIGPDLWGTGEPAAYSWVPPGTANYVDDSFRYDWADTPYDQRVEEARALMEAAGYSDSNPLPLTINYNTNDNHQRLAVAISSMWEQIHVRTELANAEVAVHYDALQNNDFDSIGRAGWLMDYNDPINMLELLRSDVDYNYGRYNNPEYDQLLRDSAVELDLDARAEILAQAETMAMEDYAALPLAFYVSRSAVSPRIEGFIPNSRDIQRTRWLTKTE